MGLKKEGWKWAGVCFGETGAVLRRMIRAWGKLLGARD